MLEALKSSHEPEHLVAQATRYLKGLKGNLVQMKKHKLAKERAKEEAASNTAAYPHQHQQYDSRTQWKQPPGPPAGPGYYQTYGWSA